MRRLLASRFDTVALLLTPRRRDELADALASLPATTPVHIAEESLVSAISGYHVHGGALALARRPDCREVTTDCLIARLVSRTAGADGASQARRTTLVALAGVTHMDNVGSIFRSAAGLGCDGIVLDDRCCDPLLRKPLRVAIGHSLVLPWSQSQTLAEDLESLRRSHGFMIVGLESGGHPGCAARVRGLRELPEADRLVFLLGNEGHGLDAPLIELCDTLVEIPMRTTVPSLNVAVATAVALYERGR